MGAFRGWSLTIDSVDQCYPESRGRTMAPTFYLLHTKVEQGARTNRGKRKEEKLAMSD